MALLELIYTSLAVPQSSAKNVKDILASSERNNTSAGITGLLLFDGDRYIQILEGEREAVEALFNVISADPRHYGLEILHKGAINNRAFQTWRMAYEALPKGLLDSLAENIAVYSLEADDGPLGDGETIGARLNGMFMDAIAAE